ncbi:MAG: caspase family protein [Rhodoferax sp.]|nr:caspase family protein [Actinomycetota bacterium]
MRRLAVGLVLALLAGCSAAGPTAPVAGPTSGRRLSTPSPSSTTAVPVPTSSRPTPAPAVRLDPAVAIVPGAVRSLGAPPGAGVDVRPPRTAPPAQRFAVLVGITDYRPPTHDTTAGAADARLWRTQLLAAGWLPQNVHLLVDGQVTGRGLRAELAWLAARSRPGTFTLFHYSGHVKQRGGRREVLWPVDRDFVDDRVVEAVLARGTGRLWVDVAGCEAGSFAGRLPSARVLFTGASTGAQKAYEYPPWGLSVWTGLLLARGMDDGGADADGDGRVTIGEGLRYATWYAQAITLTQRPYGRQTPVALGDPQRGWTLADPPA